MPARMEKSDFLLRAYRRSTICMRTVKPGRSGIIAEFIFLADQLAEKSRDI